MGLGNKQKAFVEAYLANGFNATKAALTAGYSEKTARSQGARLLTNVDIASAVDARLKAMAMSADEALARLSEHGRGDMGDFLLLTPSELANHPQSRLLHKVKITRRIIPTKDKDAEPEVEERVELELYDAQAAQLAILKEQHLRAGEATERVDGMKLKAYIGFTPDEWDDDSTA